MKIHKTRFKELGYAQIDDDCWQFIDLSTGRQVGQHYKTQYELLSNRGRYAAMFGCDPLPGETVGKLVHFEHLSDAGWIRVTHCGDENVYFTFRDQKGNEREGYCKCL